jgi:hypothetical protein
MDLARRKGRFFEMVILAIKTVKGTGMIEHGQVLVSVFRTLRIGIAWIATACARRADKVAYAVRWKRIIVVREFPFVGPSAPKLSIPDMPYATEAGCTVGDLASMVTQGTRKAFFITGRFCRKAVRPATLGVDLGDLWPDFRKMVTDAIRAKSDHI